MDTTELVQDGRKYRVIMSPDIPSGAYIVIGPPEGLVDVLGLPEPLATRLHNALYGRGILSAADASKHPKDVTGALMETLMIDVQRIVEEFFKFDKETL